MVLLCDKNERAEEEIRKAIPFIIALKKIKCPEINLAEEVKDLGKEGSDPLVQH